MELGVGSHHGLGVYAYYLRSCYAKLFDIGTFYPIRPMTVATASQSVTHLQVHRRYLCHVMTGDGFSSWNSPSSLHTPTALDKTYDDHIYDTIPYYQSRGLKSYRPSLQGFHMTIPASQFSRLDT
ncbi:UNVERIFIED_CONTAM: hypothetical protein Slati_1712400 [Sesamum latifolium]|uniref:Uncharacterized protein n=1 Tax=Sesamum latifolium TaxID=2727402 RepID=A0AAW2X0J6_9LAMI